MVFSERSPAMMHVNQELAARPNRSGDVTEHRPPMLAPLDHSEGAEETDGMIGTLIVSGE